MAESAAYVCGGSLPSAHVVLNALERPARSQALLHCCGAARWVEGMLAAHPFASDAALFETAEHVWAALSRADYLEAFSHHPRIGEDVSLLRQRFMAEPERALAVRWSREEQAGVDAADLATLEALAANNRRYLARFGYIFIVCASGKSAAEMASLLEARLHNTEEEELAIAAREQARITRLRLEKLST
jgi:2-oxo-4-hydroxy-4-carboxy-5-ureidoimidazoline decarboxylase